MSKLWKEYQHEESDMIRNYHSFTRMYHLFPDIGEMF